jgi:putative ABC transport system ATP-binding protein
MLLADEPTASLDTDTGKNLVDLMFEIGKALGCTTIISTHDPEICDLADMTVYLKDGERMTEAK